ncbi:MAG: restriction endonuclease subunit S, partial [Deltaproteobacteria bacterium]|nr:restriction endonuclease subunit S [Deltaproteobacteria bacterium]
MTDNQTISINKAELPENWDIAKIEDICTVILGQSPSSSSYNINGEGLAFFQGKAEFGAFYPKTVKWCTEPKKTALKNDILISVRAPVGPTNLSPTECCIGRGLAALRPNDGMLYKYLLYYLRSI